MNRDEKVRQKIHEHWHDFTHEDLGTIASWWEQGPEDPLHTLHLTPGQPPLAGEDYFLALRSLCPHVGSLGPCPTAPENVDHTGLHVLYHQLRTRVRCSDGTVLPRMTRNDLRERPWGRDPFRVWEASLTECEHHYHLTDPCPGCDAVEEKLEDVTPTTEAAYWTVVAHVHSTQTKPLPNPKSLVALQRRGLLTRLVHRVSGRSTFTPCLDCVESYLWEQP